MRLAMLYTQLRAEEKLLRDRAEHIGIELEPVWDEQLSLDAHEPPAWTQNVDAVLVRTLSLNRSLQVTAALETHGMRCINSHATMRTCGDKWLTTLALAEADAPTPTTRLATTVDEALTVAEEIGYPVVTKPVQGSWARGLAKANDPEALEGVLEQREAFGGPLHQQHYLQAYVDKPDRDVRAFVVGEEPIAAITREADHWITNTARGGEASDHPIDEDLAAVCRQAARAVGGGLLAIDLMETPTGHLVHEVNARMEYRNSIDPTGVDIPHRMLTHIAEAPEVIA